MKSITKLSIILCAAAACAVLPAQAQTNATAPASTNTHGPRRPAGNAANYSGVISTIDSAKMLISLKRGTNDFKVKVTSATKIFNQENQPAQLSDLAKGMRIAGSGKKGDDGVWTANTLHMAPPRGTRPHGPAAASHDGASTNTPPQ